MARMLVHAGFHKTGTTSVQRMLAHDKRALSRETHVFLRSHMVAVCESARAFSASRDNLDLLAFTYELSEFLQKLDMTDGKHVCLSSEDLLGHMPGRRKLMTYDAAPILMKAFVHTVERVMPDPPELTFYFSTRGADDWLKSCHTQHLRAVRMKQSLDEYKQGYAESARLDKIVDMVRLAVAPHRVEATALEQCKDTPLGPLTPILDLLDISSDLRGRLRPLPAANVSLPDTLREEFLRINQSDLSYDEARRAKQVVRRKWDRKRRKANG